VEDCALEGWLPLHWGVEDFALERWLPPHALWW
jgi:hypothetical protein